MKSDKNDKAQNKHETNTNDKNNNVESDHDTHLSGDESESYIDVRKKNVQGFHPSLESIPEADVSETEIAAEISIPKEEHWGWVVVIGSFLCIFILDGIFFTFGSIYKDIAEDLETDESLVALVNSVSIALYFMTGPIVSGLINRYGFRFCTMIGSVIVSFSYFSSYFAQTYVVLLIFYGIIPGLGGCFIYMSSQLVVGFYFERLRALALSIAGLGQSFGVMTMSSVNAYVCQLSGWRTTALLHSGLFGLIYFIGMIFRPLMSLTVTQQTGEEARAVTYLPSRSTLSLASPSRKKIESTTLLKEPSVAERVFKAVSNVNFPTVADMIKEEEEGKDFDDEKHDVEPGPSTEAKPEYYSPLKALSSRSYQGRISIQESKLLVTVNKEQHIPQEKKGWRRFCHWEKHAEQSRPMYRDDAFYTGTLHRLPAYQKSLMSTKRNKTGLEYRMAVSRTVTPDDLQERKGVFTTSIRRTLATMLNTALLSRCSFLMVCSVGFLSHVGLLVPYVFLPDRNKNEGIDQKHCNLFVSVIGFSNALGRLIAGTLACKFNPIKMYSIACLTAGIGSIASNFSFNLYFQYSFCVIFGIAAAHMSTLRSLVIVDLYGLDNLTNATGMLLMFQGFGSLLSTPLSSVLKYNFGYFVSFCVSGSFMAFGGVVMFGVKRAALNEENKKLQKLYGSGPRPKRPSLKRR